MSDLKPCPFCGGVGKVSFKDYEFGGQNGFGDKKIKYRTQVICNRCRSRGKPIITDWLINPDPYISKWGNCGDGTSPNGLIQTSMFKPYVEQAIEAWNRRVLEEQQMLVLSPDLTDKQVRDLFDKLRSIQPTVIGAHLTDVDLMELRDRFGKDVADVVADMISGEEKRWHKQGDGNLRTLNMKCKNCSHCTTHYYHGQDVYTYYCELAKGFTEENSYCADWSDK